MLVAEVLEEVIATTATERVSVYHITETDNGICLVENCNSMFVSVNSIGRTNCPQHALLPKGEWPEWYLFLLILICPQSSALTYTLKTNIFSGVRVVEGVGLSIADVALAQGNTET